MNISSKRILIFLLVFTSLIPDIGIKFTTFGFYWTIYRLSVLICLFLYIQSSKKKNEFIDRRAYTLWLVLMMAWLVYGIVLLVLSPYTNMHKGFVELLSIFNGLSCIYILIFAVEDKNDIEQIMSIIFWIYIMLVLIGNAEIMTGRHFPMSDFNDKTLVHLIGRRAATGIFYSENDFSAFLTCLTPILIYKKKNMFLSIVAFIGVIYINYVNDANICMIAMIMGVGYYLVFIKQYIRRNQQIIVRGILLLAMVIGIIYVWKNIDSLAENSTLLNTIRMQQLNARADQGSLYARFLMYIDSIKASVNTNFLGIGPMAFANYFTLNPSGSGLVNPHNMYLEMLVEYGLIITVFFIINLIVTVHILRRKILWCDNKEYRRKLLASCGMLVLYSIVCIAPSSFIGYAWQWIVITVGIVLAGMPEKQTNEAEQDAHIGVLKY